MPSQALAVNFKIWKIGMAGPCEPHSIAQAVSALNNKIAEASKKATLLPNLPQPQASTAMGSWISPGQPGDDC